MNTEFKPNGTQYVRELIRGAIENGSRTAVVRGDWIIEEAVRLPSDFTLVLEDCHLRLADGSFTNMFVNEHHDTEIGGTPEGTDRNISIIGRGKAILDGGKYNGLSERNHSKNGMPPIWKNNLVLFTNVDGFKLSDLSCYNQRWWALNFIYSRNGYVGNIDFRANSTAIDENGDAYHKLTWDKYEEVLVKNADGVDLRQGCHDIVIENLTGFTEDDSVALTALNGELERRFAVSGLPSDLCNVTVRNIRTAAFCTNVRLLNQGDIKLHDITIDGVYDMSEESPYLERGLYTVRVGDTRIYGTRHATADETYNITIKNVRSRSTYALSLAGEIDNLIYYGIECYGDAKMLLDERTK